MKIFRYKNSDIHISALNIDCGYSLQPPQQGSSNEYPQCIFLSRNKKNNVYPCKLQFYYIKVGFKGSKLYRHVFVMKIVWLAQRLLHPFIETTQNKVSLKQHRIMRASIPWCHGFVSKGLWVLNLYNSKTIRTTTDHVEQIWIVSKCSAENSRRSCSHKVCIPILIGPGKKLKLKKMKRKVKKKK